MIPVIQSGCWQAADCLIRLVTFYKTSTAEFGPSLDILGGAEGQQVDALTLYLGNHSNNEVELSSASVAAELPSLENSFDYPSFDRSPGFRKPTIRIRFRRSFLRLCRKSVSVQICYLVRTQPVFSRCVVRYQARDQHVAESRGHPYPGKLWFELDQLRSQPQ